MTLFESGGMLLQGLAAAAQKRGLGSEQETLPLRRIYSRSIPEAYILAGNMADMPSFPFQD